LSNKLYVCSLSARHCPVSRSLNSKSVSVSNYQISSTYLRFMLFVILIL
jgi:hypothetical protein